MVRLGIAARRALQGIRARMLEERGEAGEGPAKVPCACNGAGRHTGEERTGCCLSSFAQGEGRAQAVRSAKGKGKAHPRALAKRL